MSTITTSSMTTGVVHPVGTAHEASVVEHRDVAVREQTVAVAEVPARGAVVAEARVETHAGDHFAEARSERERAMDAAMEKERRCEEAANARPGAHAKAVFGDIGTKISAKIESGKEGRDLAKHEDAARAEESRAHSESIEAKEKARLEAIREAEAKIAGRNRGTIVSEFENGREFVAVAEVPARGAAYGTGEAVSHADDHLARAEHERELAREALLKKEDAEARLAAAHPGAEAKASIGGIGTKIHAKYHEVKEHFAEKKHDKHATAAQTKGEDELVRDKELARQKALAAAEAEAARLDAQAKAGIIDERTTTTTTTTTSSHATHTA